MRVVELAAPGCLVPVVQVSRDDLELQVENGCEQAYLDMAALAPNEARENALRGVDAGVGVCERQRKRHGGLVGVAVEPGEPGEGLYEKVLPRLSGPGTRGAISRDARIDEARVELVRFLVAQAHLGHDARTKALDEHVCLGDEALGHREALGTLRVELDALLVTVDRVKVQAVAVCDAALEHKVARAVSRAGPLDLDDAGAKVGKAQGRGGPCEVLAEIEDENSLKWLHLDHLGLRVRGHEDLVELVERLRGCELALNELVQHGAGVVLEVEVVSRYSAGVGRRRRANRVCP